MTWRSAVATLAAMATLGSCTGDGSGVADVLLVSTVDVTPPGGDLVLGGTVQLTATPKTATGVIVPGRAISWSSSNSAVVSVSPSGLITALALGGPVRIEATVDGVDGEAQITVRPFPVARVSVDPDQAGVTVGGSTALSASAYDANGGVLSDRLIFWQSSAPAIAAVTSTGIVLGMSEGGPVTITATSEGKSGTAVVSVAPRPAVRLGFLQQPGSAVAGQPITPAIRVAVQNDQGGTVTAATHSVSIALASNPGSAVLSGTTTVAAVGGIATFPNLALDKAGAGYTLSVTSTALAPATSSAFSNLAGPASQLTFATAPGSSATSGQALIPQPSLQLRDAFGNPVSQSGVVVTSSVNAGTATLGGTTTATTNASGTATFSNLSLTGSGGSVTLSFVAPGLPALVSAPITLSSGMPAALAIVTQPSPQAQSGVPLAVQPTVKLQDAGGNDVNTTGVSITASIASGPAGAVLGGTTTVSTAGTGAATFTNLAITGLSGSYTLQFSSASLTPVTSNPIAVTVGQPSRISITTPPSSTAMNGAPFAQQPVIQLRDASGNPVGVSGVTVTASIASGGGTLGGTATAVTNGAGVAQFSNLSVTGIIGNRTITFSAPGLTGATSGAVTITAGPATQLSVTIQPSSSASSGVAFPQQPRIQLRDASGNLVATAGVSITAALDFSLGFGSLGGTKTVTTNGSGLATFTNLTITAGGIYSLRFTSSGLSDVVSSSVIVN